jgi:hypothetical protein
MAADRPLIAIRCSSFRMTGRVTAPPRSASLARLLPQLTDRPAQRLRTGRSVRTTDRSRAPRLTSRPGRNGASVVTCSRCCGCRSPWACRTSARRSASGSPGVRTRLRVSWVFGVFEAGMPTLGPLIGHGLAAHLGEATRWIGGGLLIATGGYGLLQNRRQSRPLRPRTGPAPGQPHRHQAGAEHRQRRGRIRLGRLSRTCRPCRCGYRCRQCHAVPCRPELGARIGGRTGHHSETLGGLILTVVGAAITVGLL